MINLGFLKCYFLVFVTVTEHTCPMSKSGHLSISSHLSTQLVPPNTCPHSLAHNPSGVWTKLEHEMLPELNPEDRFVKENPTDQSNANKVEMSLAAPITISQPDVRAWVNRRRENIRPVGTFFSTNNFQIPPSVGRLTTRLKKNVEYFQSNYMLVFLVMVVYCLISSPILLMVIAVAGGAAYFAAKKNNERKVTILGHEVTLAHQLGAIIVCSSPFLVIAGAGAAVFWVLGASIFTVTVHAAFYNYDALEVPGDHEPLVGEVQEV